MIENNLIRKLFLFGVVTWIIGIPQYISERFYNYTVNPIEYIIVFLLYLIGIAVTNRR